MKKQIILFVLLLSLMTAGVFPLQNTIGYASESSGRNIVTIVFDDSFSMANENRYSNAKYAIQSAIFHGRRGDCRGLPAETKGAGTPRFPCPS